MARRKAIVHKFLSREQVTNLLDAPRQAGRHRDYFLLSLTYYLALREAEAVAMRPEYISIETEEARIPSVKRKPREGDDVCLHTGRILIPVPILFGKRVIEAAVRWTREQDSEWMFPSSHVEGQPIGTRQARRTFHLWTRVAGLPKEVSMHSLRHSAGTHVNEIAGDRIRAAGGDGHVLIRDFMRHSNIQTTSTYLQSTPTLLERARRAMRGAGA